MTGRPLTTCIRCGRPMPIRTDCPVCPPKPARLPAGRHLLTTVERGYGAEHKRLRRTLLPLAYGTPCAWCGRTMLPGEALDLDHECGPGTHATRMLHSSCKRRRQ